MSDAPEPYVRRNANDLIRAADWNDIQIKTRQEFRTHTHTGGAQGTKLTGEAIDPSTSLTVQNATVSGTLRVRARELLAEIDAITAKIAALQTAGGAGATALADKELRLRVATDGNHALRYAGGSQPFAGLNTDGPALYGYSGGVLGTTAGQQSAALSWDTSTVTVDHELRLGNSDTYFARTDHRHTGRGNQAGMAAIENDGGIYQALMILGRAVQTNPLRRIVKLYDMLEIYGSANDANNPVLRAHHSNGAAIVELGATRGPYGGDSVYGLPNLWLDARDRVIIKPGYSSSGFDVAERFPAAMPVRSGEVVIYDSDRGAVMPCVRTGDPRVVGIVSQAPACILGLEENEPPVALCGRVPCKVDADIAPIAPGDLLTTSPTRGHAQKAADPSQAVGAIIGKALEARDSGRGEILVFVSIQ